MSWSGKQFTRAFARIAWNIPGISGMVWFGIVVHDFQCFSFQNFSFYRVRIVNKCRALEQAT